MNGKVLDVEGAGGCGSKVINYCPKSPPAPNQLWRLEPAGNGWNFIVSGLSPNLVRITSSQFSDISVWKWWPIRTIKPLKQGGGAGEGVQRPNEGTRDLRTNFIYHTISE